MKKEDKQKETDVNEIYIDKQKEKKRKKKFFAFSFFNHFHHTILHHHLPYQPFDHHHPIQQKQILLF